MPENMPYTKREEDLWRDFATKRFDSIQESIDRNQKHLEETLAPFSKTLDMLARVESHNSGQIIALWDKLEKDKQAVEFINDSLKFGKFVKWVALFIIGAATLYSSAKILIG